MAVKENRQDTKQQMLQPNRLKDVYLEIQVGCESDCARCDSSTQTDSSTQSCSVISTVKEIQTKALDPSGTHIQTVMQIPHIENAMGSFNRGQVYQSEENNRRRVVSTLCMGHKRTVQVLKKLTAGSKNQP